MGVGQYYWRWVKTAVGHSWGLADSISSAAGAAIALVGHYLPDASAALNSLLWEVPLWALGAVVICRFLMAPYRMAKKDQARTAELEAVEGAQQHPEQSQQTLASLIEEGRAFFRQRLTTSDEYAVWKTELDGWLQRSADAVTRHFSHAKGRVYLIDPTVSAVSWRGAFSERHNTALSKLDIYLKRLTEMAHSS